MTDKPSPEPRHWRDRGPSDLELRSVPPPLFLSWKDYLARTSDAERIAWCREKAKKANRTYANSPPRPKITKQQVWEVLKAAQGGCAYCGSLAVEHAPVNPVTRQIAPWAQIGRRIGSLDHGDNLDNLAWCCLWCNTWPQERGLLALDHGGYYPRD